MPCSLSARGAVSAKKDYGLEPEMTRRIHILSISDHDDLRNSREMLLVHEGYETTSITSSEALTMASSHSFDIALICGTVGSKMAARIKARLQQLNPELQILEIGPIVRNIQPYAFDLEINSAPSLLLQAIRRMGNDNSRVR